MSSAFESAVNAALEAGSADPIAAILHPDVVFCSPAVYKPYQGKAATHQVLNAFVATVSDFRYTARYASEDGEVLRFTGKVGDREIEGVDIVTTDADGLVTELTVLIRPLKGLGELVGHMAARLADSVG